MGFEMIGILLSLMAHSIVSTAGAQPVPVYPRTVIKCQLMKGELILREEKLGEFSYSASVGATGEVMSGAAKISFAKRVGSKEGAPEKCVLSVQGGEGEKRFSNEFSWWIADGAQARPEARTPDATSGCYLMKRYSKSITNCVMPDAKEPGNQCHGDRGLDVTAHLPKVKGSSVSAKIIAFSGGMSYEPLPKGAGEKAGKAFVVWRRPGADGQWCYSVGRTFPDDCTRLASRILI
jgi:hypothetical protein